MTRGRARRYLLTKQGYYPGVVASMGYDVWDWSTLNAGTLFQDSAKTTPASANGDVIGCWTDGVSGVDATQATTANKPTYTTGSLNGLPTLGFDGGDLLATGNISISTFAVWVVTKSSPSNAMIIEQSSNANSLDGLYIYSGSGGLAINVRRTTLRSYKQADFALSGLTFDLLRHENGGANATNLLYKNGAASVYNLNTPSDNVGTGTATEPLFIGARSGVALTMTGNIAHLCIVSPYPTPAIIASMESYINGIWSVY